MKFALVVTLREQAACGGDQHRKQSECRPERHAVALRQAGELGPIHERDTRDTEQGTKRHPSRNRLLEKEPRAERGEQRARRIPAPPPPPPHPLPPLPHPPPPHPPHRDPPHP